MRNKIEFLFAHWAVPYLKNMRGARWTELIQRVSKLDSTHPDSLGFALMMVRLSGCGTCDAKRYRERGGCANCARFVLGTLSKENEAELLVRYRAARKEIDKMFRDSKSRQEEFDEQVAA